MHVNAYVDIHVEFNLSTTITRGQNLLAKFLKDARAKIF